MTTGAGPTRRTVPLPDTDRLPRVGKIRLGEAIPTGKTDRYGEAVTRPTALEHFRVVADESGITSAEAAESFLARYGEAPTVIRAQLAGATPEDVMEGAYRLYGTGKLKRKCDGQECDERTKTGGWQTLPCVCAGLAEDSKDRCKLSFTINLFLPDVRGFGVWQVETGSEISVRRMTAWLRLMHDVRSRQGGDLWLVEFELGLVPVQVAPDGKAKTVYVLDPRTIATPREVLSAGLAPVAALEAGPENPAPAADEDAEAVDGDPERDDDPVGLVAITHGVTRREVEIVLEGFGAKSLDDVTEAMLTDAHQHFAALADEPAADAAWAASATALYTIDLTTGAARPAGMIASPGFSVVSLAAVRE